MLKQASSLQLFDCNPLPSWICEKNAFHILEVNKKAVNDFGYSRQQYLKMSLLDLISVPEAKFPCYGEIRSESGSFESFQFFSSIISHEGEDVYLITASPVERSLTGYSQVHQKDSAHAFRDAIANVSIISVADKRGNITYVNDNFKKISGYTSEELIGRNYRIMSSGYHPPIFWTNMWKTITSGKTWRGEIKNKSRDGSYYWVDTFIMPLLDKDGDVKEFLSIRNDISWKKVNEEELRQSKERLSEAMTLAKMGIAEMNLANMHFRLSDELLSIIEDYTVQGREIVLNEFIERYVVPEDQELVVEVIKNGLNDSELRTFSAQFRLRTPKDVIKVVDLQGRFINRDHVIGIFQDITKQKQAETELLVKSRHIEQILFSITDGFFVIDRNFNFTLVNPVFLRMVKMEESQVLGRSILDLFPLIGKNDLYEIYKESLLTGKSRSFEYQDPQQESAYLQFNIYPTQDGLFVYYKDISSIKEAEREKETLWNTYRRLFETNPMPMWIFDLETLRFLDVNDTAVQLYGYTKDEFRAMTILDIRPKVDQQKLQSLLKTTPRNSYSESEGWRHLLKDGTLIEVDIYAHTIDYYGRKARFVVINDVTSKRKTANEIKKLALIASHTSNAVILTDEFGLINWVNEGFERMTGYELNEVIGRKPGDILQGEETDAGTVAKMRNSFYHGEGYKVEVLNYTKYKKKYWVDIEVMPIRDEHQHITGYMAIETDITALKTALAEMFKSQTLLQTIMDNAPLLVSLKDLDGRYTFYNRSFAKFFPGNYAKGIVTDFDLFSKEDAEGFKAIDDQIRKTGRTVEIEQDIWYKNKYESFYTIKFPLNDEQGKTYAIGGVSLKITDRKIAEQELQINRKKLERQNQVLEVINRVQQQYINEVKPEIFFKSVLHDLVSITESKFGFIGEVIYHQEEDGIKTLAASASKSQDFSEAVVINNFKHCLHKVVMTGKPLLMNKTSESDVSQFAFSSFIGIPLLKGSDYMGILGLADRPGGYDSFCIQEIQPLIAVLSNIVDALHNDLQRKEAEESLRESEQRFKAMADSAPVLIWMTNERQKDVYFNKGWVDFTGLPLEEALETGWLYFVHPEDRQHALESFQQAFEKLESLTIEYRLRHHDGEYRWVVDNGLPRYLPNGEFVGYIGTCVDIHERKLAEYSLLVSEARYRSIVDDQPEMICRFIEGGVLTFVNNAYAKAFNMEADDLIGESYFKFLPEVFKKEHAVYIQGLFKGEQVASPVQEEIKLADGSIVWQEWFNVPLKNSNGEVYEIQAIGHDITQRKKLEAEQRHLDMIVRESYNEIYLFNFSTFDFEYANASALRNLGYTRSELLKLRFLDLFNYPDEMAFQALLNPLKRGETDRVHLQIKHNRKDGSYYDVDTVIQILEPGRSLVAISTDITQKLLTEKKLLASVVEKDMLIKEIHHRVKNNLQLISSIIYIKMSSLKEPEMRYFLEDTRQKIRSMALIHERLLQSENLDKVDIKDYLGRLIHDLQITNYRQDLNLEIKTNLQHTILDIDSAIYCGLIVNELVTNAIKHAFKDRNRGEIEISFRQESKSYLLEVCDDGVTLPDDVKPGKSGSFGMQLLEIFIRQIGGTIEIIREKGTIFQVRF
jgi:PAS domain S-box-containing protein